MILFYSENINHGLTIFPEIESRHVIQVLRKQVGDHIFFVDGQGGYYEGVIQDPHPKRCAVQVISQKQKFGKREYSLHLAVGPTKNIDRFEWFLEKATEIGIDRITPVISFHSERKQVKIDRLNRVITAAMKQSLKAYRPILDEVITFKNFMSLNFDCNKLIAHCQPDKLLPIRSVLKPQSNTLILIGPEGDFSDEEITLAKDRGFTPISLGESRLRTETAAIVATHAVYFVNQKM